MGLLDTIAPTPRNRFLGLLADAAQGVSDFAAKPFGYNNPPGELVAGLLGVPDIAKTLDRLSYGEPLTTGTGMTLRPREEAVNAAMAALPLGATLGKGAIDAGVYAAQKAAPAIERVVPRIMKRGGLPAEILRGMSQQTVSPLTVWHGSPHKFDKFDASKIGTGEGAQAYGHGLYLAESPEVAKNYLPSLSNDEAATKIMESLAMSGRGTYGLRVLPDSQNIGDVLNPSMRWVNGDITNKPLRGVSVAAIKNGDVLSALSNLGISKPGKNGYYFGNEVALVKGENAKAGQDIGEWTLQNAKVIDKFMKKGRGADPLLGGNLYKVDLPDEHIAKMLDWDKPLSEQPHVMDLINKQEAARTQAVLDQRMQTLANVGNDAPNAATLRRQIEILREEVANPQGSGLGSMTGGEYYNYLRRRDVPPTEQADMFRNAGIPGIRYLDGGSRGTGAGTSNFVVFPGNEKILKILERNGKPVGLLGN